MCASTSNNATSSNNVAPQSQPTPKHQVYDPLVPPPTGLSQISPQSNGTESTDDFAAEPFAGLEDPFVVDEGGVESWRQNGSGYLPPPNPAVPTPQQDEDSEAMRAFVQEMIETRTETKEWDERVEIERGQGVRPRPGSAARERLRKRAERRRERMGVLEEVAMQREAERVDEAMEVEKQEEKEEVLQEPQRKKIRLSEDVVVDGKKKDG